MAGRRMMFSPLIPSMDLRPRDPTRIVAASSGITGLTWSTFMGPPPPEGPLDSETFFHRGAARPARWSCGFTEPPHRNQLAGDYRGGHRGVGRRRGLVFAARLREAVDDALGLQGGRRHAGGRREGARGGLRPGDR